MMSATDSGGFHRSTPLQTAAFLNRLARAARCRAWARHRLRTLGRSIGAVILAIPLISGCSGSNQGEAKDRNAVARPPVPVELAQVVETDLTESIDVVGSLSAKFETDVQSEYSGIVTELYVTEWVHVKKGTPLAKMDTREVAATTEAARAALLQAQVSENKANREYERALKLKQGGLITQQNLDDTLTAKEAAAAATASARAQVAVVEARFAKALIRSPMDGVVSYRGVSVGDYVENMGARKPMFTIVDNRKLDLTVTVPSGDMGKVKTGALITFATDALPGKSFSGTVKYINPKVDELNRSVKVIAEVVNDSEELRGGLFVKGRIITNSRNGVPVVPRSALQNWDVVKGEAQVFVLENEVAVKRNVQTGLVSGDLVEIVAGLTAEQDVITRGAFNIRENDRLNVVASQQGA